MSVAVPITQGGTWLTLTYGRGFRAPSFNDLYLSFPGYTPNPDLKPEQSRNSEISLRGTWGPVSSWRVTGFDNKLEDLIVFSPSAGTVLNVNRARVRGIEATFEAKAWTLDWRGSVTFQRPEDEATGHRLQNRAERFGALEVGRGWGSFAASLSMVASGDRYDSSNEAESSRLGSYVRVDGRVRYDISKMWKAEVSLVNLFDRKYETSLGYPAPRRGIMLNVRMEAF
jgi:vitamin B12 transporter